MIIKKNQSVVLILTVLFATTLFGRGEGWVPKPPPPPAREDLTNSALYVEWKWRRNVTDLATGLDFAQLETEVKRIVALEEPTEPWSVVKADCYAFICDHMAIDVSPLDWYPAMSVWNRYRRPLSGVIRTRNDKIGRLFYPEVLARIEAGNREGKWTTWKDFDHSVPEWEKILPLGFPGLRQRLHENWQNTPYYTACDRVAAANLRFLDRLIDQGEKRRGKAGGAGVGVGGGGGGGVGGGRLEKEIASLRRLRAGAPRTAYDVLQFIYLYFVLSEHVDVMQCRSLSIIDKVLWPYYRADLAAGRTTESEFREQFRHFLWQWGSIDNYWGQPITMGGTKADGTTEYNPLSYVILDVMDECALPTPKFHLKIAENTPQDILNKSLDMIRRHRSISFIGEKPVRRMLMHYGYTADEARRFYTKGCYEVCCPEGANGTGVGYVNVLKPIERMLAEAVDEAFAAATFEDFFTAYLARTVAVLAESRDSALVFEQHLDDVNPANLSSLANENSVKTGKDAFANGTARGNNTHIQVSGFGTAVDALLAVKEIVYDQKLMSLADLGRVMAKNWEGAEELRLRMLRSPHKWGTNDTEAKRLGARLAKALSKTVNGKPNSRGGMFGLCGHNARAFIYQGEATGATPDGRKKGEEFSKNLSATMGADTEGVTALVQTLAALDSRDWPGDFPLDVMLLRNTVEGEKGLDLMKTLLFTYFDHGGLVLQFNISDAAELREAQAHPEKYENLQVRVCGWNVRWNDLPKKEQDAYILRAEKIAE